MVTEWFCRLGVLGEDPQAQQGVPILLPCSQRPADQHCRQVRNTCMGCRQPILQSPARQAHWSTRTFHIPRGPSFCAKPTKFFFFTTAGWRVQEETSWEPESRLDCISCTPGLYPTSVMIGHVLSSPWADHSQPTRARSLQATARNCRNLASAFPAKLSTHVDTS